MTARLRVLVVDDSAVVREALRGVLEQTPSIAAVETAADGTIALRKLERFRPDVVTMDVEMPGMDGLATLKRIMATAPRPVIMLSAFTSQGARKTIRALELGAADFIQKPSGEGARGVIGIAEELVAKVIAFGAAPPPRARLVPAPPEEDALAPAAKRSRAPAASVAESAAVVVAIGASTGGTEAIRHVVTNLPADFSAGVVVTQHMPEGFTLAFANRLNELSLVEVKEAAQHDVVRPGRVLVAPGHSHLQVRREGGVAYVELSRLPPVNGHRPSVDVMFDSVADTFGSLCIGALLTGMGRDGARGLLDMRRLGAPTLAESEESCVVFGMPRAAIEALGAAKHVSAILDIPGLIARLVLMLQSARRRERRDLRTRTGSCRGTATPRGGTPTG